MCERFDNIWHVLEDMPEQTENMKLRAVLLTAIKKQISERKLTQANAAKLFGVTQPRISDLIRGKINLFALDTLVNMTVAAGLQVGLRVLEAI